MNDHKRLYLLMSIMMVVSLLVGGIAIFVLYRAAIIEQREWLMENARSQARLIESVARFDAVESSNYPQGSAAATISQVVDAHRQFKGVGKTGEFTLARREGEQIVFLGHRGAVKDLSVVPWRSSLAEPMRRALSGLSGTDIAIDYRGQTVLAAYEPVAELNLGIVAKVDLSEVRAPYIRAGLLSFVAGLTVVSLASLLFLRVSNPLIAHMNTQHARLTGILETAAEGIITFDEQGIIQSFNPASERMFGRDAEAVLGENVKILSETPLQLCCREPFGGTAAADCAEAKEVCCEIVGIRKDGSRFPMELAISQVSVGGQHFFTGIVRDITERKQAVQNERLAAMGKMLSSVAHESRNSLQRIHAAVDMLRLDHQDDPDVVSELERIEKASLDLKKLYEELREYAAPITLDRKPCDLREVWRIAWANLTHLRQDRQVEFREETDGIDLSCLIDEFRVEQVFRNLMENSLAACDDPTVIEIKCYETEQNGSRVVCVAFSDNGPGLTKEQTDRVFEAFFTTKSKGTGLGMAIVRRMVEAHQGMITVGNSGQGGAEFVIRFPRDDASQASCDA